MGNQNSKMVVALQDATALDLMRRVVADPEIQGRQIRLAARRREYPESELTVARAFCAGREEAKQAALATGVDFMARYEAMCKRLWDTLDLAAGE